MSSNFEITNFTKTERYVDHEFRMWLILSIKYNSLGIHLSWANGTWHAEINQVDKAGQLHPFVLVNGIPSPRWPLRPENKYPYSPMEIFGPLRRLANCNPSGDKQIGLLVCDVFGREIKYRVEITSDPVRTVASLLTSEPPNVDMERLPWRLAEYGAANKKICTLRNRQSGEEDLFIVINDVIPHGFEIAPPPSFFSELLHDFLTVIKKPFMVISRLAASRKKATTP